MTSRLERLFVLLETGTSSATRRAAASQLGDVARAHPAELPRLLARLARVLRSPQWETRVAAGAAVEAILAHLPNQFLKVKKEEESADVKVEPEPQQPPPSNETPTSSKKLLSFTSFDVVSLLTPPQGTTSSHFLMASSTSVFDESTSTTAKSLTSGSAATSDLSGQKTTAAEQRSAINKRLGLDIAEKMGILDSSDIVSNEDLLPMEEDAMTPTERAAAPKFVLPTQLFDPDMSSRELNAAKRRARKQKSFEGKKKVMRMSSTTSNNAAEDGNSGGSSRDDMEEVNGNADGQPDEEENSQEEGGAGQWPLQRWVDVLLNDIFAPQWEIRHGAATALREVLKSPAAVGGGRNTQMTTSQSDEAHKEWLEDLTLRLVSVLALDRFGDYVSDGVVAPVRESVAQCVGAAAALMNSGGQEVIQLVKFLAVLLKQKQWEVRHGALLALKYLLAVKQDAVGDLLPLAFPPMLQALREDAVDDVTAAAASALLPVAHILTKSLGQEAVSELLVLLWGSLPSLDDLSSAAAPSLALLAVLPQVNALSNLPALLPFLSHASSSVRRSALVTLHKLLLPPPQDMKPLPRDNGLPQSSLQSALRLLFQRALLEPLEDVASYVPPVWRDLLKSSPLSALLHAACPLFGTWLALAMTPPRAAIDPPLLHRANPDAIQPTTKVYMGGSPDSDSARTRMMLAEMLGMLAPYIVKPAEENQASAVGGQEPPLELFVRLLLVHLGSRSALQRSLTSFVISWWPPESSEEVRVHIKQEDAKPEIIPVKEEATPIKAHPDLKSRLHALLTDTVYFDEVAVALSRLQSESRDLAATLRHYSVPVRPDLPIQGLPQGSSQVFFTLSQIEYLAKDGGLTEAIRAAAKRPKVIETLIERRRVIEVLHSQTVTEYNALSVMTGGAVASAVVSLGKAALPPKLAPVVKPLMESLRSEHSELFQKKAADALVTLMTLVVDRDPCPNSKIVGNLVGYVTEGAFEYKKDLKDKEEEEDAIISLKQMNAGEVSGSSKKGPQDANDLEEEKLRIAQEIRVRGGSLALRRIAEVFGPQVWSKVSKLWDVTFGVLEAKDNKTEQEVLSALLILEIIAPSLHSSCWSLLEERTPKLCALLLTPGASSAVRHHTARALAAWGALKPSAVLPPAALALLPALGSVTSPVSARAGAMETLWALVSSLGLRLLPYVSLFVLPALSAMSDPAGPSVRALAAVTFATLVRLLPLDGAPLPDLPDVLPPQLLSLRHQQRAFLDQLLNPANIPTFKVTSKVKAELRPYQQAGVDWLAFLRRFGLHGILADDMGLGKTLQAIAILASHHAEEKDSSKSLVVCPPTLTGHWVYEVEKFVEGDVLRPLHYHGAPGERTRLQGLLSTANLLVASYDIVRNDLPFFAAIPFHFVILDEGHVIKNGKTKISKAMKELNSKHRLILTGTPIQNGVLELHSLFDFLMPGFLGSEKSFHARFSRPILAARDPKASPKDQEGGALALETLHRTALPFLLRRLKEDVLADLPPKVTQDYYCDLSPIQVTLYEDFARTRAAASLRTVASSGDDPSKHTHIFQALQYLRKVVNHPKLVLSDAHPLHATIMAGLAKQRTTLNDISIAAKLPALKQLLLDCGIGVTSDLGGDELGGVVAPHRALIFCQLKAMLDIVEKDLLKVHLPSVTFLRLDGSVPAGQRHSLVQRFNNDPSIDLLLLTTQVGGLGLNLTGADTVIFVEHDWNPMRDLQAMDRAHRIGQRRTVNVYRLITRATLEEKIMGLQKFKLMTARTVISEENARLETMGTEGLLDLFVLDEGSQKKAKESQRSDDAGAVVGTYRSVLEALPELWDDSLYDAEYDLSSFIKTLKST